MEWGGVGVEKVAGLRKVECDEPDRSNGVVVSEICAKMGGALQPLDMTLLLNIIFHHFNVDIM